MKPQFPKNKWFYAFVIAVAVALVAAIVAVVVGVVANRPPEYVEGDEIGVYYYDVAEGEVLLTLSGGNTFTIAGPGINKTGTYTVEGTTITLDFVKDEDGVTTATIDGEKIALIYDNATMMFVKKNEYTVSFNVGGGSEIPAVKVVNGKTVAKPADPTKENCVFLGWYADEALTVPYAFDTVAIKADATVYAKWAEKTVGVTEYTVDFNLGYEGATALDAITTISGKAYGVITPEREGYTFGGWWISMYEDASKLSYAYTENTVFTADTTLFAVWHDNASTKLKAPAVSVKADAITWTSVDGASSYKLTIVDPDGNTLVDNETVGATTKAYDFADKKAGEYQIIVVAVSNNEANNSDPAVRSYANKALDRVSQFDVVNGVLVFGAVENVQKYLITIDCGDDKHTHTSFDNGLSTTYYLGNCPMQKGGIMITVTAVADGYAASVSKTFVYDLTLDQVADVEYDNTMDAFVWDVVPNATTYYVTVVVDGKSYTFDNGTRTKFELSAYTGNITVSVVPVAPGYNSPAASAGTCEKTAPAAPNGVTVSGMVINWNAVPGATSYEVKIGTQTAVVTTNSIDLASSTISLAQGQNYDVQVRAINESNESSAYSKAVKIGYFVMNSDLTYNKNTVYWTPVLGVNQYQVKVNGGVVTTVKDQTFAKVTLTQEGANLIEVRYIYGETTSDWVSMTVMAHAVEYDTRSVGFGSFLVEYLAVGDEMMLPATGFSYEGFDFAGWYNAPKGAAGNGKLYAEGATFQGNAYTVVYAEWTPKTYSVTFRTDGFDITNIENGAQESVVFTKHFTLTVPEATNTGMYFFSGWYTGPSGTGVQITDENGQSVAPYTIPRDIVLYPYYSTNALTFTMQDDGTYAVSKGTTIAGVTNLVIPATYNEIPVTKILESGFSSCSSLVRISMPDTITLVGTSAFTSCTNLEYIDVYKAKEGNYETFYSSDNGVLIREDMGTTYLEFVPRAMTGDYVISTKVDKILTKAFYYSKLESITIPNNVISIPKYAFYYCKSLKNINFEMGRTNPLEIESYAFYSCSAVESVKLPGNTEMDLAGIKSILNSFTSLKSIEIEEGNPNFASVGGMLTNAEKTAILYAPRAYTGALSIPNGITTIGSQAFSNCANITSITIPVWVTTIEDQAFYSCYGVKDLTFKGGRSEDLTIGKNAFAYYRALEAINFEGNGTTELDEGKITILDAAFRGSSSTTSTGVHGLRTINIGAGVNIASIGKQAFTYQILLRNINIDPTASIAVIGESAFENCLQLTSFTVPATVTSIATKAFAGCESLTSIQFATEGATELEIADFAFMNCTRIATITLPDHLDEFRSTAFEGCDSIKEIKVSATNKHYINDENGILYKKEENSTALTELLFYPKGLAKENNGVVNNLPSTLTTIGGSAFSNNNYLVSVTIPASVTVIDNNAFSECGSLKEVVFVAGGTTLRIGDSAFASCTELATIDLPSYTTAIGASAFANCVFTSFTVPEKVTVIGKAAFYKCVNLEEVTFKCDGALTIGKDATNISTGAFSGCVALKSISLPAGTTEIGKYAFYECEAMESADLGSSVTMINTYAFGRCYALKSVFIPKTVTTIGNSAFYMQGGEGSLEEVIFEPYGTEALEVGTNAFGYNPGLKTITFPARTKKLGGVDSPTASYTKSLAGVRNIFVSCPEFAAINIDNDLVEGAKQYFLTIDGVLYNADATVLIYCPVANVGAYNAQGEPTYELIIPNTVKLVATYALQENTALQTVTFAEFDKSDANYGKQLLTIGNYTGTSVKTYSYATIGGKTTSITTINLPSHLAKINQAAFGTQNAPHPITLNINPDATNVELAQYAFIQSDFTSISLTSVKNINTYAFANSDLLESVTIGTWPSTVKKIPDYTFYYCKALKSFDIPAHVTELGVSAFQYCDQLTSITLSNKVTKLGKYAFGGTGLTEITLPAGLTDANISGGYQFYGCSALKKVVFAEGSKITKIPLDMFYNCIELEDINLYDLNIKEIGNSAFNGCLKITEIDFSKFPNLTKIGTLAFSKGSLVHVDLSGTKLTKLDTSFSQIETLKSIAIPETVTSIVSSAFNKLPALETITLTTQTTGDMLSALRGVSANVIIPEGNPYLVRDAFGVIYDPGYQIVYFAGGKLSNLKGYTIPETVMTISPYSFAYAIGDELIIPEGVTLIGEYAFQYSQIPHISVPSTVTKIGKYAFSYSGLTTLDFANEHNSKLELIEQFAFRQCNVEKVVLPDSVTFTASEYSHFFECYNLKSFTFGASVTVIPRNIFGDCFALEEVIFQEGLEHIQYMFATSSLATRGEMTQVKSLHIPASVKLIDEYAAQSFSMMETLSFAPNSMLETIGKGAFKYCFSLKTIVNLPSSIATIGEEAFYDCSSLEALDMGSLAVTDIPVNTFFNSASMTTLVLPKNLATIGENAFYGCGVVDLHIPATVTSIGKSAFENATAMKTLTFPQDSMFITLGSLEEELSIFKGAVSLETLVLPNALTAIGKGVFENTGIKNVEMADLSAPSGLTDIGANAFRNCVNLTSFDHLGMAETIGDAAFMGCTSLESALPAEGLEYMGAMAFAFCNNLKETYIPKSVTTLGGNPYAGFASDRVNVADDHANLTVERKDGVLTIYDASRTTLLAVYGATGEYVFDQGIARVASGALAGNAITAAVLPANIAFIEDYIFMNCSDLTSVTLMPGVTSIGNYSFYNTNLATVEIPSTVESIGDNAFALCRSLDNVTIPKSVDTFGNYCFAGCATLSNFVFEETTAYQVMGTHFFYNCPNITQIILPSRPKMTDADAEDCANGESLTYSAGAIPSYTFAGTGIVHAVIPETAFYLHGKGVFADCKKLETVTLEKNPSSSTYAYQISPTWFEGCDNFKYVYAETITNSLAYIVEAVSKGNVKELRIGTITSEDTYRPMGSYARFIYANETMTLRFVGNTYQEIIEYMAPNKNAWTLPIYDRDGNRLYSAEDNGSVAYVEDPNGNVIWTAPEVTE